MTMWFVTGTLVTPTSPLKDTFNVFAAFAGDIDTIVFDGNSLIVGSSKAEENGGRYRPGQFVLFLTKLGRQFDGYVVEFVFFRFLPEPEAEE